MRLSDKCLTVCNISLNDILMLGNITNRICRKKCVIFLSSISNYYNKQFQQYYRNVYIYNPRQKIKHSSKSKEFNRKDIEKTIIDIYLASSSDYLILSGGSTFSLLILYTGYYKNHEKCISKEYFFLNNFELYDHLEKFRKIKNCKRIII